jgi:hypothetical protein
VRRGTLDEQLYRRNGGHVGRTGVGHRERFEVHPHLAREVEHLAACGQQAHVRAAGEHSRRDPLRLVHHRPAAVEYEQRPDGAEAPDDGLERVLVAPHGVSAHRTRDDARHVRGLPGTREVDEPRAVGDLRLERSRRLQSQTALADARGPCHGDKPVPAQQPQDVVKRLLAIDERAHRGG